MITIPAWLTTAALWFAFLTVMVAVRESRKDVLSYRVTPQEYAEQKYWDE